MARPGSGQTPITRERDMPNAIVLREFGPAENLVFEEVARPEPGPGQGPSPNSFFPEEERNFKKCTLFLISQL